MEKIIIERIFVLSYNELSDIKIDSLIQDDLISYVKKLN